MLYEAVVELIGEVPVGYEPLIYCLCLPVLLWLCGQLFSALWALFASIGGRK